MGLDMYLTGQMYIGGEYEHRKVSVVPSSRENPVYVPLDAIEEG